MSGVRSRVLLLSALVAVLVAATPSSASAATIRRTWTATISGVSARGAVAKGTAVLVGYWAGNASFSTQHQGLSPSATYTVTVVGGTCSKPAILLQLPGLATDANGEMIVIMTGCAMRMTPACWGESSLMYCKYRLRRKVTADVAL